MGNTAAATCFDCGGPSDDVVCVDCLDLSDEVERWRRWCHAEHGRDCTCHELSEPALRYALRMTTPLEAVLLAVAEPVICPAGYNHEALRSAPLDVFMAATVRLPHMPDREAYQTMGDVCLVRNCLCKSTIYYPLPSAAQVAA